MNRYSYCLHHMSHSRLFLYVLGFPWWLRSLGQKDPLEKGMATHSSILAWRIPRTEEPGRLLGVGVGHKDSDN